MSSFDWTFPHPSRRMPVLARNVVATSQPLAAESGLSMLRRGGNAVDAAVAAAIALTVVEPTNNGVGSDAFAIVWDGERVHGLNASGRSPAALSSRRFEGRSAMPATGWDSVTVPGAVSAWVELSGRFGRLPFGDLFEPAIRYATDGHPVSPVVARQWGLQAGLLKENPAFAATFLPSGRAPEAGEIFRCPSLARTLAEIAATGGESFYRGALAARIATEARSAGGLLDERDLASHRADPVEPLGIDVAGVRLHELPPNTQGLAALVALALLDRLGLAEHAPDSAASIHLQIEATKIGLSEVRREVGDPAAMRIDPRSLIEPGWLDAAAKRVDRRRARPLGGAGGPGGDTVYLSAGDAEGRMVSFIQSNYFGFGSGIVVPETGISLQNRASGFTLERGHPNEVGGGKLPFHTLIPAFVTRGGEAFMSFGVMGGPMQAQGHVQMIVRMLLHRRNPQAAVDAPRWQAMQGLDVAVEPGFDGAVLEELRARGHVVSELDPMWFGGAQIVCRDGEAYVAASEPRKDGQAVGF